MSFSNIAKFFDYQITVSVIMALVAWKWGDWRNWKLYYPTMLYFIIGDFLYGLLTYNYALWEFESPLLKTVMSDILISFVAFPATILLFLPHFPQIWVKRILYILMWVVIYTVIEIISYHLGFFSYQNGWSIWWSILFNCMMFPMLRLYYKKPLIAWTITLPIVVIFLLYFKVPFSTMK